MNEVKLIKYDTACRALAEAKRVDEAKTIRDVAIAMRAYAKQADNRDLEADAIEIRMRATRRMDQLRQQQKATVGLAKGGQPHQKKNKSTGLAKNPVAATLAEAGINKTLAHEGRKLGAMSGKEFEKAVTTARDAIGHVVKQALRTDDKTERRVLREQQLASKITALPKKKYGVIYADPEWRFEPWSRQTGMDRAADNHYPTSCLEVVKARNVPSIGANDCVLFLWATVPMLPEALEVMRGWGFEYKIARGLGQGSHRHWLLVSQSS